MYRLNINLLREPYMIYKLIKNKGEIIMKTDKDGLVVNPNSKIFGRSAYLCYNQSCIELALKKSKLNKALKTNVTLEKAILLDLLKKEK